jgi:hypothetical protein
MPTCRDSLHADPQVTQVISGLPGGVACSAGDLPVPGLHRLRQLIQRPSGRKPVSAQSRAVANRSAIPASKAMISAKFSRLRHQRSSLHCGQWPRTAGGAGGARTHDRRIMRSMTRCIVRTTCTDTIESCLRWP